ncbi:flagellar biosynthesis repressor FlbT [Mangrovicella endophytica]|uniref:flagellar biosynthesis repressor FlbT n=1 Tax=Mangrovicella endophytica TaxID=2066697 RepID=UPI000C9DEFB0|nr:flagellar biosynthesis repressor FlbT [Mangrovicella endophytica]
MATLRISLRAGERIFVNGAVMRVDRKTTLEFLNDVVFLLESHVLQAHDATTPLRQLYFIVQMMLIDPSNADEAKGLFARSFALLSQSFDKAEIRDGLVEIDGMIARNRAFDALKKLRALIPMEDEILARRAAPTASNDAEARPARMMQGA